MAVTRGADPLSFALVGSGALPVNTGLRAHVNKTPRQATRYDVWISNVLGTIAGSDLIREQRTGAAGTRIRRTDIYLLFEKRYRLSNARVFVVVY